MNSLNLIGIVALVVFVLCGRLIMGLFPPKNVKDWWKILSLSLLVIVSMIPMIFLDFQHS